MFTFITRVAGTEVASNSVCTILVASTDVMCTLVNVCKYNEKYALYQMWCLYQTQETLGQSLTNTGSVIMFNFITWVAGTEVASNSVCTILIASTVVKSTLVDVFNSIGKNKL